MIRSLVRRGLNLRCFARCAKFWKRTTSQESGGRRKTPGYWRETKRRFIFGPNDTSFLPETRAWKYSDITSFPEITLQFCYGPVVVFLERPRVFSANSERRRLAGNPRVKSPNNPQWAGKRRARALCLEFFC